MSYLASTQDRSCPRPDPKRYTLSAAMAATQTTAGSPAAAAELNVLDRLEAIYRAVQHTPNLDQAIRLPEVLAIAGVSKSTWYARLNPRSPSYDPRAPQPFKLGTSERSPSVWWRSAVMAYVQACADAQIAR